MRVQELIAILEDCDPDAEVLIMSQQQWPFENRIYGVAVREEFMEPDEEDDDEGADRNRSGGDESPNDVFIVEGEQLRYGSKGAWTVALRH